MAATQRRPGPPLPPLAQHRLTRNRSISSESLGKTNCALVLEMSWRAKHATRNLKDKNVQNAVRHFIWQVLLVHYVGASAATRIGDAHEYGLQKFSGEQKDSARDQANNAFSRRWAARNPNFVRDAFRKRIMNGVVDMLYKEGVKLYRRDTLRRHRMSGSAQYLVPPRRRVSATRASMGA